MFVESCSLFGHYSPRPLNDVAVPPFAALEADDEQEHEAQSRDFDLEINQAAWEAIPPAESPRDAPIRFIDGTIASRTAGQINVGGRSRPLIAATIAAACLEMDGRSLRRSELLTKKVLCVMSNGIEPEHVLEAESALQALDVRLLTGESEQIGDFDSLRRSTRSIAMTAMEEAERDVMLAGVSQPTLVDGLLERRLQGTRQEMPVVGLVKRQIATYLPAHLQEFTYGLGCGERTPAFLLKTVQHVDLVNCYVRLSVQPGTSPSYGIVRMTVPYEYVLRHHAGAAMTTYLSGLAGYIYRLRHRDLAYDRSGISIEPIVRVEEHLHALRPNIDVLVHKLNALLRNAPVPEVTRGVS